MQYQFVSKLNIVKHIHVLNQTIFKKIYLALIKVFNLDLNRVIQLSNLTGTLFHALFIRKKNELL